MKQKYSVKGMTCSACENHVHNSVCKLPGVNNVEVNLLTNSMNVEFDENQVNDAMIIKAVSDGGYQANVFSDSLVDDDDLSKLKKKLIYCFISFNQNFIINFQFRNLNKFFFTIMNSTSNN